MIGVAVRVWIFTTSIGQLDADEAVWGLMAKHAMSGDLDAFLWGQHYGGTLEAYLSGPLIALFGPHKITVELVPILLSCTAVWLVWRIGKRVVGEPAARIAAALYWIWPAYVLWKSTKAHGFYASGVVLGLLAVLLVVRLTEKTSVRDLAALGLVFGLGWWITPQIIVYALPLLLWLVLWRPATLKRAHYLAFGAALGALPWIAYNLSHGWASIHGTVTTGGALGTHLTGAFRNALPAILGLRVPWSQEWVLTPWVGRTLYLAALAVFAWWTIRGKWGVRMQPLVLIALAYPFVVVLSPLSWYVIEPRYYYFLAPIVVLLAVKLVSSWNKQVFYGVLGAAVLTSAVGLAFMTEREVTSQGAPDVRLPADVGPLVDLLEAEEVRHVYANYWIAHLVTYWTDERIIGVENSRVPRHEEYAAAAAADPSAARAFVEGSATADSYQGELEAAGTPYERHEADGFVVYIPDPQGASAD